MLLSCIYWASVGRAPTWDLFNWPYCFPATCLALLCFLGLFWVFRKSSSAFRRQASLSLGAEVFGFDCFNVPASSFLGLGGIWAGKVLSATYKCSLGLYSLCISDGLLSCAFSITTSSLNRGTLCVFSIYKVKDSALAASIIFSSSIWLLLSSLSRKSASVPLRCILLMGSSVTLPKHILVDPYTSLIFSTLVISSVLALSIYDEAMNSCIGSTESGLSGGEIILCLFTNKGDSCSYSGPLSSSSCFAEEIKAEV